MLDPWKALPPEEMTRATKTQLTVSQGSDKVFTLLGELCRDSGTLLSASIPRVAWKSPHMSSAELGPTLLGILTMLYLDILFRRDMALKLVFIGSSVRRPLSAQRPCAPCRPCT